MANDTQTSQPQLFTRNATGLVVPNEGADSEELKDVAPD